MIIKDGIVYADNFEQLLKVVRVRTLPDFWLDVTFNNGREKTFDMKTLLNGPGFNALRNIRMFNSVSLDHGVPVWNNGDIDITPEYLYEHGIEIE